MSNENIEGVMRENRYIFWISQGMHCIAFRKIVGYKEIQTKTEEELWTLVYNLLELGYRVL